MVVVHMQLSHVINNYSHFRQILFCHFCSNISRLTHSAASISVSQEENRELKLESNNKYQKRNVHFVWTNETQYCKYIFNAKFMYQRDKVALRNLKTSRCRLPEAAAFVENDLDRLALQESAQPLSFRLSFYNSL